MLDHNFLLEVFSYLHPFTLHECRLVCKKWNGVIIDPSTAKRFFEQRYGISIPPLLNITYRDLYFPLPGGEKYRSLEICFRDSLRQKGFLTNTYFASLLDKIGLDLSNTFLNDCLFFTSSISQDEFNLVRGYFEKTSKISLVPSYASLVAITGDLDLFKEIYAKIDLSNVNIFLSSFLNTIISYGHPSLPSIIEMINRKEWMSKFPHAFQRRHPHIDYLFSYFGWDPRIKILTMINVNRLKKPLIISSTTSGRTRF